MGIMIKIYHLIRYSYFGYFIKVNFIIWGFLIMASVLAYLNNDNAKFF